MTLSDEFLESTDPPNMEELPPPEKAQDAPRHRAAVPSRLVPDIHVGQDERPQVQQTSL